jgi:hypothetical protein
MILISNQKHLLYIKTKIKLPVTTEHRHLKHIIGISLVSEIKYGYRESWYHLQYRSDRNGIKWQFLLCRVYMCISAIYFGPFIYILLEIMSKSLQGRRMQRGIMCK